MIFCDIFWPTTLIFDPPRGSKIGSFASPKGSKCFLTLFFDRPGFEDLPPGLNAYVYRLTQYILLYIFVFHVKMCANYVPTVVRIGFWHKFDSERSDIQNNAHVGRFFKKKFFSSLGAAWFNRYFLWYYLVQLRWFLTPVGVKNRFIWLPEGEQMLYKLVLRLIYGVMNLYRAPSMRFKTIPIHSIIHFRFPCKNGAEMSSDGGQNRFLT